MEYDKITGILLAGGKSSRFGTDKSLADFRGKPMIEYAISALKPVCDTLLISANENHSGYRKYGFEIVEDQVKNIGPMGGVLACLKRSETRYNMVLSCDTPFVSPEMFRYLLQSIENFQAVVPIHDKGKIEPLAAVYATNLLWYLQQCVEKKEYSMHRFLKESNTRFVDVNDSLPFFTDELFVNINTQHDAGLFKGD